MDDLPSPEHVSWLIANDKIYPNLLKLVKIEYSIGQYLSEKLSLKMRVQVCEFPKIYEGITVRVAGGEKVAFYSYESLLQKDVFMVRVFKDFIFD